MEELYECVCPRCNGIGRRWITKNGRKVRTHCYKCSGRGKIFLNWIENVFGVGYGGKKSI
jgi:DnaJ-class molecular chaperone